MFFFQVTGVLGLSYCLEVSILLGEMFGKFFEFIGVKLGVWSMGIGIVWCVWMGWVE